MTVEQLAIVAVLAATMALFCWDRWRHDVVAMAAMLICVAAGLVPASDAFAGFGHPAVVTVVCVLVLGHGLQVSGAVDVLAHRALPSRAGPTLGILSLVGLSALLSSFINNVGALALLMPIAIQMATRHKIPAGKVLMPLAFGSILGGMTTLIGTPTNLIVSGFRASSGGGNFAMFDFAPVGVGVAVLGTLFVGLIGWRMVPARKQADSAGFVSDAYFSEVRIVEGSKAANKRLREVEKMLDDADAQIVALVRHDVRITTPYSGWILRVDDILVIEVDPGSLTSVLSKLGLELAENVPQPDDAAAASEGKSSDARPKSKADAQPEGEARAAVEPPAADVDHHDASRSDAPGAKDKGPDKIKDKSKSDVDEIVVRELVVTPTGAIVDRSASDIEMRTAYGVNLLAISRKGSRTIKRLRSTPIQAGDVLLMQGPNESVARFAAQFGCLPLVARDIRVPKKGHALQASLIMLAAVALAAFGVTSAAVAFAAGALAFVVAGVVPLRSIYTAIDWPVVVLLGAMLPVANAMASTGAADIIARVLMDTLAQGQAVPALVVLLVVTIVLSNVMNNAATAAVMCPIGLSTAFQLGVNADAFLMAIAIGASTAFLTPIGHQNNTLILGPGGFRFGDYWRFGLALTLLVVAVATPLTLKFWPL